MPLFLIVNAETQIFYIETPAIYSKNSGGYSTIALSIVDLP